MENAFVLPNAKHQTRHSSTYMLGDPQRVCPMTHGAWGESITRIHSLWTGQSVPGEGVSMGIELAWLIHPTFSNHVSHPVCPCHPHIWEGKGRGKEGPGVICSRRELW